MKAIVRTRFGGPEVLRIEEIEKPVPNEVRGVLVKIHASSINPADRYEMKAPFIIRLIMRGGLRKPKDPRLGSDVAGTVEAVSEKITQFKLGDRVFGSAPGGYAEYALAREDRLALMPDNSTFEEAASVPIAGLTALQALRDHGQIQSGQKVLVNGAAGGVGTFAVQIAKAFGAEVTGVTRTENLDLARSLGADQVLDYTKDDFTKTGTKYDLICDIGASHSIRDYKRALNANGIVVAVGFKNRVLLRLAVFAVTKALWPKGGRKFRFFIAKINQKDLAVMSQLMETGKLRPVIDKQFPLGETGEAMKHLEEGRTKGKIIVGISPEIREENKLVSRLEMAA